MRSTFAHQSSACRGEDVATANTTVTERAFAPLHRQVAATEVAIGQALALVYLEAFREPDGSMVAGFRPGYGVDAWPANQMTRWKTARLTDGTELHFFPVSGRADGDSFVIDLVESPLVLFDIRAAD